MKAAAGTDKQRWEREVLEPAVDRQRQIAVGDLREDLQADHSPSQRDL